MKLFSEVTTKSFNDCLLESKEELNENTGEKNIFLEGIFMQAEQKNQNNRIYPKKILENAVNNFIENKIKKNRAIGELNHPNSPSINLDKVSHKITSLKMEGNDVIGKAVLLDTPMGNIAKGLIKGGIQLGVSSRGLGSVQSKNGISYVSEDYQLNTVDIVENPSAPGAFPKGIMENVEWVSKDGVFVPMDEEENREIDEETLLQVFINFSEGL